MIYNIILITNLNKDKNHKNNKNNNSNSNSNNNNNNHNKWVAVIRVCHKKKMQKMILVEIS